MASPDGLCGTWRLVSWRVEVIETGERLHLFGDEPPGFIHFTPEGRVFAVLTAAGRKPIQSQADEIAAFGTLVAYSGVYRIEDGRLITRVDVSYDPAAVGSDLVRYFELRGDELEITTAPFTSSKPSHGLGNKKLRSYLSWTRDRTEAAS